jgi:hypothetical protein
MTTVPEGHDVDVSSGAHSGIDGFLCAGSDAALTSCCGALLPAFFTTGSNLLTGDVFPTQSIAKACEADRRCISSRPGTVTSRLDRSLGAKTHVAARRATDVHGLVAAATSPDTGGTR